MFSLHIDTARTWRGGQNQVLLTVNGLRAIGERAALVAHPDGELRRRASEGLELIPIAPRTEMDLSAAFRLSRVIKRLTPDVIHAHDPHGVAMAGLALSLGASSTKHSRAPALVASRRVDFHLKGNSFSRWKYRQVDCFIAASDAIRQMLVADGVPAAQTVTVHEGIDVEHVVAAPPVNVHEAFWLPHQAPVVGNGTGSTLGLFKRAATGEDDRATAKVIGNPHNQTLSIAVQWGMIGVILLYAMWLVHLLLFRGDGLMPWVGLLVVVQNVLTSLFNSHLFDFVDCSQEVESLGAGAQAGCTTNL